MSHLPTVTNVVVIDTTHLSVPDQMFLAYQLERFVQTLPQGKPLAVYLRLGDHSIQVQSLTADRQQLLQAVRRSLPRMAPYGANPDADAFTLHQIALDLAAVPGRKNVLWFTGALAQTVTLSKLESVKTGPGLRPIYDELQAARLAIYPIDARGLMISNPYGPASWSVMQQVAEATGGTATYNSNGVALEAERIVSHADSFYTLSYTPTGLEFDGKWHKIRVGVDGKDAEGKSFQLSYRHGFFADDSSKAVPDEARTRLSIAGITVQERPSERARPIVFSAEITPVPSDAIKPGDTPLAAGRMRYEVHFALPSADYEQHFLRNEPELQVGYAVLVMDTYGRLLGRIVRQAAFGVNEEALRLHPNASVPITQQVDLKPGQTYLYLATWDPTTERTGSMTIPLTVPKRP